MLHPQTKKKVVELFQLNSLRAESHISKDAKGNQAAFWVDMLWIVRLGYYQYPSIVAVMHAPQGAKGLFFVPNYRDPPIKDLGILTNPVKTVALTGWEDPVQQALHSVNMAVLHRDIYEDDDPGYHFWIHVYTPAQYAELTAYCPDNDPTWDRLGEAVLATVKTIVGKYKNRKMRKFLKSVPYYRWQPG